MRWGKKTRAHRLRKRQAARIIAARIIFDFSEVPDSGEVYVAARATPRFSLSLSPIRPPVRFLLCFFILAALLPTVLSRLCAGRNRMVV
jgi:hypothetical protein